MSPLIEIDEEWSKFEEEERKQRVINREHIKVQLFKWDLMTSSKGTRQIQWRGRVIEDPDYQDREVLAWTPIEGRGKYLFKNLAVACDVALMGKGIDPDAFMGKVLMFELEQQADDDGSKRTRVKGYSKA